MLERQAMQEQEPRLETQELQEQLLQKLNLWLTIQLQSRQVNQ